MTDPRIAVHTSAQHNWPAVNVLQMYSMTSGRLFVLRVMSAFGPTLRLSIEATLKLIIFSRAMAKGKVNKGKCK